MISLGALRVRLGWLPRRKGRSILCLALDQNPGTRAACAALLTQLEASFPRLRLYTFGLALGQPLAALPREGAWRRLLLRGKAHGVFVAGGTPSPALQTACSALGLPLLQHTANLGWHEPASAQGFDAEGALTAYGAALTQGPKREARARFGDRWLRALARRRFHRLSDLEALRAALGHPERILALGNGPSSENASLKNHRYDALFRVNHSWKARGFLPEPQLVFTGLRATVAAVNETTCLVFQTERDFEALLPRCAFISGSRRFCTAEQLGLFPAAGGVFRPTNGAIMIAVAVALAPKRLCLGGIDLFAHPEGAYPGDPNTPNAYTVAHDRQDELGFMAQQLGAYAGELEIKSPILRDALGERGGDALALEALEEDRH